MAFAEGVARLVESGFFQFFAPFALVFSIVMGVLLKYKPFGNWKNDEGKTNIIFLIYFVISFLTGLFVMVYGLNVYIEAFLAWTLGRAGLILILLMVAIIIAAFSKGGGENLGGEQ